MKKPNILLLFTDQQRFDTIGAHGNPIIRTPALDQLAGMGTSFTRAYTPCPVCVPARYAMLTGRMPFQSGWRPSIAVTVTNIPSLLPTAR